MRLKVASFTVPVGHSCRDTEIANSVDSLQSSSLHIVQITKQERKGYECRATSANGSIIYSRPRQKETRKYEPTKAVAWVDDTRKRGNISRVRWRIRTGKVTRPERGKREPRRLSIIVQEPWCCCCRCCCLLVLYLALSSPVPNTYIHKLYKQSGRATSGSWRLSPMVIARLKEGSKGLESLLKARGRFPSIEKPSWWKRNKSGKKERARKLRARWENVVEMMLSNQNVHIHKSLVHYLLETAVHQLKLLAAES